MSSMLKVADNEYMPLRDVVFQTLRQAIIKGELKPGERLLEVQLADQLGVSRTPIREAIRKLELEGLVVMMPRRGATVSGITQKHLQDVLEIRRALEQLAVELACDRMTDEEKLRMTEAQEMFRANADTDDALELANMDERFHDIVYEATRNPRLVTMLANLREQMYRYRLECIRAKDRRKQLVREHDQLTEAIREHRVDEARKAITRHINNQEITVLKNLYKPEKPDRSRREG